MEDTVVETRLGKAWVGEDGILHVLVLPGGEMTLDDARESIAVAYEITRGSKYRVLIEMREVKSISREAREYFVSEEAERICSALALVGTSPVSRVIGNFFLGLNKPPYPTKLFTSDAEAIEWLNGFAQ